MSVDPPSPSGPPERDRPASPDASPEVTDSDLWNLDEDLPARPAAAPTPRTASKKPVVEEIGSAPESASSPEKSVQRAKTRARAAEKPKEDLFTTPQTSRNVPDEIGELDQDSAEETAVLKVIPENEIPQTAPAPAPAPAPVPLPESPAAPEPEPIAESKAPETLEGSLKSSSDEPRRNRPKAPAAKAEELSWTRPSRRDILSLGAFAFVLLLVAIWVISRFFTQLHFQSKMVDMPDFPVSGQHATLSEAETYWREPVRDGPSRDVAKREVVMIPVLDLSLESGKSSQGALRIIFRNNEGTPIGDPITRSFSGGHFDASGNAKISFPSTNGFTDKGTFNGYRTRTGRPWMADVMEGPSVDAPAGSFKLLVQIPVLPQPR